jgi:hypothetical protein
VVASQTVLVVLSVYKYVATAEYRREKLVIVLVRDGTAAFFAIMCECHSTFTCSLSSEAFEVMSALQMFYVFISWPASYVFYPYVSSGGVDEYLSYWLPAPQMVCVLRVIISKFSTALQVSTPLIDIRNNRHVV